MTILRSIAALLLTLACGIAAPAAEPGDESGGLWPANVGAARLMLPVPAGHVEATLVAPGLRQVAERFLPASNRLLAYFVSEAEIRTLSAEPESGLNRYFMVQTLRSLEGRDLSADDFAEGRRFIRAEYTRLLPRAVASIQPHVDSVVRDLRETQAPDLGAVRIGELSGLELFLDDEHAVGLLALTKVSVQAKGRTVDKPMVVASVTARVGRRLVYFYAYSAYRDGDDLEWARRQSREWLARALASNP